MECIYYMYISMCFYIDSFSSDIYFFQVVFLLLRQKQIDQMFVGFAEPRNCHVKYKYCLLQFFNGFSLNIKRTTRFIYLLFIIYYLLFNSASV